MVIVFKYPTIYTRLVPRFSISDQRQCQLLLKLQLAQVLSNNHLSSQIPPQFANLTFLAFLDLSNNELVGKIPTSTQISTFPNTSFEGNKGLWGPPLTMDAVLPPPILNGSSSNPNSGDEIDGDVICVEIGFTCGFGIVIVSLSFCKKWRKWYHRAMRSILFKIFPQLEQRFGNHRRHIYVNTRR
ncbi:hypothetical protein ABKV19_020687 [Rosa sericea]